jgi:hypothetical protein
MLPEIMKNMCQAEKSTWWILVGGRMLFAEVREFGEHSSYADRISMRGPVKQNRISEILKQ